jgi:hypothetical protein
MLNILCANMQDLAGLSSTVRGQRRTGLCHKPASNQVNQAYYLPAAIQSSQPATNQPASPKPRAPLPSQPHQSLQHPANSNTSTLTT